MNAAIRAAVWASFSSEVQARGGYHEDSDLIEGNHKQPGPRTVAA